MGIFLFVPTGIFVEMLFNDANCMKLFRYYQLNHKNYKSFSNRQFYLRFNFFLSILEIPKL